jgi:hypothetical protein
MRVLIWVAMGLMLASAPALAEPYISNAVLVANAASSKFENNPHAGVWGLQGSAGLSFTDSHLNFEGDLAYSHAAVHGFTQEQLHLGGNLVWWEPAWRIGASAAGHRIDVPGSVRETQNYGLYGVWFPSGSLTLMTKAGAFSGHAHGNYAGGGTNWYLTPDIYRCSARWTGRASTADFAKRTGPLPSNISLRKIGRCPLSPVTRAPIFQAAFPPMRTRYSSRCAFFSIAAARHPWWAVSAPDLSAGRRRSGRRA